MARITIDDCLQRIPNRFELTLAATYRSRQITTGSAPMLDPDRDKPTISAATIKPIATVRNSAVLSNASAERKPPARRRDCIRARR